MTEKDITICGHGSGFPSLKNMESYLSSRYAAKMSNGVRKGLIRVRRVKGMTDAEREKFVEAYTEILGRNYYSQSLREYVFRKYKGSYYSDCSSSGDACWAHAGHDVGWLNTVGQKNSYLLEDVPVRIVDGHVQNPEVLKVGDALLFAGNESRPSEDYCGHVEYVFRIASDPGWHWISDGPNWYYQDQYGHNTHGWRLIQESGSSAKHWYFFNSSGKMVTGLVHIGGETYYLQESGPLEGARCCVNEKGALVPWYL